MRTGTALSAVGPLCYAALAMLAGCASSGGLYGGGSGGNGSGNGNANANTGDDSPNENTMRLAAITFSPESGFPQGPGPADFEIGGGSITATGGAAGTLGRPGLYADDDFAWDFFAGSTGNITFDALQVVAVDGYWVHSDSQHAGASMTVNFSGGGALAVASAPVSAGGSFGQSGGFFDTVTAPDGETITGLDFDFDDGGDAGDVAALDVLELTVATSP